RTPDTISVTCGDQSLTYRELEGRANQLARYLQAHGVQPESLVGLCLDRSVEMLVGLLGILKAGGAYIPLDPSWPAERLALIAANSRLSLIVTETRLLDVVPRGAAARIALDRDGELI